MAVGIDQDSESIQRAGIPSGGAGTLSDGAFANMAALVWLYRPSAGNSYGLTSDGCIIHLQAGAREVKVGFDNTFGAGTPTDPLLQALFNSGGGTGAVQTFAGANFLDEWVAYFYYEASGSQRVGYIRQSAPTTVVGITRANDNAGSQFANTLTFGNHSAAGTAVMGHYAYARARYGTGFTDADMIAWAASTAPMAGDWGFWALPNNTGNADTSGNARDLTFNGTLTSEASPVLDGTAPVLSAPTAAVVSSSVATIGVTTDEGNGTLFVVLTGSSTQPSVAQIKAGQDHTGTAASWSGTLAITSAGSKSLDATALTANTTYYAHLVHTDAAGNDSNRVSSGAFSTYQRIAPSTDISIGSWLSSLGGALAAAIDEAIAEDGDYVTTVTPADEFIVALQAGIDPSSNANHHISYRIAGDGVSGLQVSLMQGSTVIATWTHNPAPVLATTFKQTLSAGEADSITDYTALRLRFTEV